MQIERASKFKNFEKIFVATLCKKEKIFVATLYVDHIKRYAVKVCGLKRTPEARINAVAQV